MMFVFTWETWYNGRIIIIIEVVIIEELNI